MLDGFLWAIGFSGGMVMGVFAWVFAFMMFDNFSGRKKERKEIINYNELSLVELRKRNELTIQQIASLDTIAKSAAKANETV